MTPAQLAAVFYLAHFSKRTNTLYADHLRRWFDWCQTGGLDPLIGIKRAHVEIHHAEDRLPEIAGEECEPAEPQGPVTQSGLLNAPRHTGDTSREDTSGGAFWEQRLRIMMR